MSEQATLEGKILRHKSASEFADTVIEARPSRLHVSYGIGGFVAGTDWSVSFATDDGLVHTYQGDTANKDSKGYTYSREVKLITDASKVVGAVNVRGFVEPSKLNDGIYFVFEHGLNLDNWGVSPRSTLEAWVEAANSLPTGNTSVSYLVDGASGFIEMTSSVGLKSAVSSIGNFKLNHDA